MDSLDALLISLCPPEPRYSRSTFFFFLQTRGVLAGGLVKLCLLLLFSNQKIFSSGAFFFCHFRPRQWTASQLTFSAHE